MNADDPKLLAMSRILYALSILGDYDQDTVLEACRQKLRIKVGPTTPGDGERLKKIYEIWANYGGPEDTTS